jgi:methyl-accepting chemotaxis protein
MSEIQAASVQRFEEIHRLMCDAAERVRDLARGAEVAAEQVRSLEDHMSQAAERVQALAGRADVAADQVRSLGDHMSVAAERVHTFAGRADMAAEQVQSLGDHMSVAAERVHTFAGRADMAAEQVQSVGGRISQAAERVQALAGRADVAADQVRSLGGLMSQFAQSFQQGLADTRAVAHETERRIASACDDVMARAGSANDEMQEHSQVLRATREDLAVLVEQAKTETIALAREVRDLREHSQVIHRELVELAASRPEALLQAIDNVHFSAFAPGKVESDSHFLLEIWAFVETQRAEAMARAERGQGRHEVGSRGPIRIERGSDVSLFVEIPGFDVDPAFDVLHWAGEIANVSFDVAVPPTIAVGKYPGRARVICGGRQVARIQFEIQVSESSGDRGLLTTNQRPIRTIFASYAAEDRIEVLRWKRGAEAAGAEVFVDVLSLRTGQNWEEELWKQVPSMDLFCLFWSKAASESAWVEKEWQCALARRGCEYIYPVPLVDPREVHPPAKLAACTHFEDLARIVIEYEKTARKALAV